MKRASALWLAAALPALAGCTDEAIDPVGAPAPTDPPPSTSTGQDPPIPGPKVREVMLRNPIGLPFDNLLADGDFELSIVSSDGGQYGWLVFDDGGAPTAPLAETGGLCRSGLRCLRAKGESILYAQGTAAAGEVPHRASIWMKLVDPAAAPADSPCDLARVRVIGCSDFQTRETLKEASAPAADGWCEIAGVVEASTTALCLYITIEDAEVLVDQATLLPAPDAAKQSGPPAFPAPTPKESAAMARVREIIRNKRVVTRDASPDVRRRHEE